MPGFKVNGRVTPDAVNLSAENPAPVVVVALIVTGAVPVELKVTDLVSELLIATLPNARLEPLTSKVGTYAFNSRETPPETPPEVACTVATCAVPTADTVAVNSAFLALAGTVMEAGTVTSGLLLDRLTRWPPAGACWLSLTRQESVPEPVKEDWLQVTAASWAVAANAAVAPRLIKTKRSTAVQRTRHLAPLAQFIG